MKNSMFKGSFSPKYCVGKGISVLLLIIHLQFNDVDFLLAWGEEGWGEEG